MRLQGVILGLLLSVAVIAPFSRADITDSSIIRASLIKAGVVASAVVGNPFGGAVADFFTLNFNTGTIVPTTTETVTTSFTRATVSSIDDGLGREGVQINSGEVPFVGHDRIENLLGGSQGQGLIDDWATKAGVTVETGYSDPAGGTDAVRITADSGGIWYVGRGVNNLPVGTDVAHSLWVRRVSGSTSFLNYTGQNGGITLSTDITDEWQRVSSLATTDNASTFVGIRLAALNDVIEVYGEQHENVSGKPNKAPGQYTSVGVPNVDLGAPTLQTLGAGWTDNGDGSYSADGSISTAPIKFSVPRALEVGAKFKVSLDIDAGGVGTNMYFAHVNGAHTSYPSPVSVASVAGGSWEYTDTADFAGPASAWQMFIPADADFTIRNLKVTVADHGANVDGVRYSPYHNPRYVDSNNVVQNDSATGELISSSNNRFANILRTGDDYTQTDSPDNSPSTDMTLIAYIVPGELTATYSIIGKYDGGASPWRWYYDLTKKMYLNIGGVVATSSTAMPLEVGKGIWVKTTFDDSADEVSFSYSFEPRTTDENSVTWIDHVTGRSLSASGIGTTGDIQLGSHSTGKIQPLVGRVYSAHIIKSTDATVAPSASFNANDATGWTANGNAYITTPPDPAVRISEARTNLQVYSQEFDNAAWTKVNATITTDQIAAPDGTSTADVLGDDGATGTGNVAVRVTPTLSTSTDYTVSVWAKAKQLSHLAFVVDSYDAGANGNTWFNLNTAAAGTTSANHTTHVERGPDGWVRAGITFNTGADGTGRVWILAADGDNDLLADLDGTSDIYIWGAQFEAGSYPTGYIKTDASAVARNADQLSYEGFALGEDISIYANLTPRQVPVGGRVVSVSDGSNANRLWMYTAGSEYYALRTADSANDALVLIDGSPSADTEYKYGISMGADDVETYSEGTSVSTDSATDPFTSTLDTVEIGHNGGSNVTGIQDMYVIKLFDTRLTDAEQEALAQ